MQLVPCFNRRFDRSAAGGYLEVRPFDFHRDGPAATIRFLAPGPNIVGHRDHAHFDPNGINQILREGCLRPRGFSLAVGLNRTIVLAAVFGPTPWNFAIGSVATKASASSGRIANWPFGLR